MREWEWEEPLSGTALSFLLFSALIPGTYFLLLLSSQPDGAPDFVTSVSASQPLPLTPRIIHHRVLDSDTREDRQNRPPSAASGGAFLGGRTVLDSDTREARVKRTPVLR